MPLREESADAVEVAGVVLTVRQLVVDAVDELVRRGPQVRAVGVAGVVNAITLTIATLN
jgi:hypothetical protein